MACPRSGTVEEQFRLGQAEPEEIAESWPARLSCGLSMISDESSTNFATL
jgi:hypothetical protein